MYTSSIINIPAWNQAQWKGVMFMAYKGHCVPPVLSFIFGTDHGKAIWEDWRKLMGNHDINNRLGIRIIKGIDCKHPNWYRVAIGPNSFSSDSGADLFIASLPVRLHTMQPSKASSRQRLLYSSTTRLRRSENSMPMIRLTFLYSSIA